MKWLVDRKVTAGFGLAMLMLVVIGVVAYDDITSLINASGWVSHTEAVLAKQEQILSETEDIETGCRGYVISGDSVYLQPYLHAQLDLQSQIDALRAMTSDNPGTLRGLNVLEPLIKRELYLTRQMVQSRKEHGSSAAMTDALSVERTTMQAIRAQIEEMKQFEKKLLAARNQQEQVSAGNVKLTVALGTLAAIMILLLTLHVLNLETIERYRTQMKLERASAISEDHARQLEIANKELEAFSYSVSHDLRAPLRHINGFIQMLRNEYSPSIDGKGQRYINTITQAASRMGQLIDDLLAFSQMGRIEIKKSVVDFNSMVAEIVEEQKQEEKDRSIEWNIQRLPVVLGDPGLLRLVFVNLISNALKYTRSRPQAEIEIGWKQQGKEVCFHVSDNGVGFDMAHAGKLFGVFQRLHREEDFEGTGIGLANVQRIVHRHGGRVWAQGVLDKGAIFYFTLPKSDHGSRMRTDAIFSESRP